MKLLYVTQVFENGVADFRVDISTPCCALATALILDHVIVIQSLGVFDYAAAAYLMHNGAKYKADYCPGCGKKIEIRETRRVQMVKRTKTVEYWDEA